MTGLRLKTSALFGVLVLALAVALVVAFPVLRADALVAGDTGLTNAPAVEQGKTKAQILENGSYVINVVKDTSLMVEGLGSTKEESSGVTLKEDAASESQSWSLIWDEDNGAYRIRNDNSKLYVTANKAKAGKKMLSLAKKSKSELQLWSVEKADEGYTICPKADSSLALGTWSSKTLKDANLTLVDKQSKALSFYILPVKCELEMSKKSQLDGVFANISLESATELNIDIKGKSENDNASAIIAKEGESKTQTWYFKSVGKRNGLYRIINTGSNKALSVEGEGRHVGTDVVQVTESAPSMMQQWWVLPKGENGYTFISRYNGLTLSAESAKEEANISLGVTEENSVFTIREISPLSPGCYRMSPTGNSNLSVCVPKGSKEQNVQLKLTTSNESQMAQKFVISKEAENRYSIRSATSNRCIGEVQGKVVQGSRIASGAQLWKAAWKDGAIVLKNVKTGHYLSMSKSAKKGSKLIAKNKCQASQAQFSLTKCLLLENGMFHLCKGTSSKVIGISENNIDRNGSPVGIFKKARSLVLMYHVDYCGTDSSGADLYTIRNEFNCKYITTEKSKVVQKDYVDSNAQRWEPVLSGTGMIAFKNAETGKYLSFGKSRMTSVSAKKASVSDVSFSLKKANPMNALQWDAYRRLLPNYSKTNYAVLVNLSNHRLYVWERANKKSPWGLKYDWICSSGSFGNGTPTGSFNRLSSGRKRLINPPTWPDGTPHFSSFYYLTWVGPGTYIHTPLYEKGSWTKIKDGRMGQFISGGCIRVRTNNAIWVYNHIKRGTRMITYY